jgi:hypothetical protein
MGEGDVAAGFDLVDDRALIDEVHVEVENVVADEEVTGLPIIGFQRLVNDKTVRIIFVVFIR